MFNYSEMVVVVAGAMVVGFGLTLLAATVIPWLLEWFMLYLEYVHNHVQG